MSFSVFLLLFFLILSHKVEVCLQIIDISIICKWGNLKYRRRVKTRNIFNIKKFAVIVVMSCILRYANMLLLSMSLNVCELQMKCNQPNSKHHLAASPQISVNWDMAVLTGASSWSIKGTYLRDDVYLLLAIKWWSCGCKWGENDCSGIALKNNIATGQLVYGSVVCMMLLQSTADGPWNRPGHPHSKN